MGLAGNSRPCSGSEHVISHAIDYLHVGQGLHGEQVALGALYVQALREEKGLPKLADRAVEMIRSRLPTSPEVIGISKGQFLEAVRFAPRTRPNRYTVLSQPHSDDFLDHVYELAFKGRPQGSAIAAQ